MELRKSEVEGIKKCIEQNQVFAITAHINPDGDAVGSTLALAAVLRTLGKDVRVIMPNDCPDFLKWLTGYDTILLFDKQTEEATAFFHKADVIFCLDYNNPSRLEKMGKVIDEVKKPLILIDHHPYPECDALYAISEPKACSTAELVYRTVIACGYESTITKEIAEALYTGIITDTGGLVHNSGNPDVYRIVAKLLCIGVDKDYIHDQIFNVYSFERMKLMGVVLKDNFVFFPQYKAAYMYITIENQKEFNFQLGDSEGFVNLPLSAKNIKFCALFTEYSNCVTKASFRSKGMFPANEFSGKFFHGGGHLNAAGGRLSCSLKDALVVFEKGLESYKELLNS